MKYELILREQIEEQIVHALEILQRNRTQYEIGGYTRDEISMVSHFLKRH